MTRRKVPARKGAERGRGGAGGGASRPLPAADADAYAHPPHPSPPRPQSPGSPSHEEDAVFVTSIARYVDDLPVENIAGLMKEIEAKLGPLAVAEYRLYAAISDAGRDGLDLSQEEWAFRSPEVPMALWSLLRSGAILPRFLFRRGDVVVVWEHAAEVPDEAVPYLSVRYSVADAGEVSGGG